MKLLPEPQWRRLCLVKPRCDDGAVGTDGAHCRLKGVVAAAQFDRHISARARRDLADRVGKLLVWDEGVRCPLTFGGLTPRGDTVNGDHGRTVEDSEPGGEEADDTLTENCNRRTDSEISSENSVQRNGPHAHERGRERIKMGGEDVAAEGFDGQDALGAVTPDAPDSVPEAGCIRGASRGIGGDLDHLADLRVSPSVKGVRKLSVLRRSVEEPEFRVPLGREVRVGAAVCGQFGSCRDTRIQGADTHLSGPELLMRGVDDIDRAGSREAKKAVHCVRPIRLRGGTNISTRPRPLVYRHYAEGALLSKHPHPERRCDEDVAYH